MCNLILGETKLSSRSDSRKIDSRSVAQTGRWSHAARVWGLISGSGLETWSVARGWTVFSCGARGMPLSWFPGGQRGCNSAVGWLLLPVSFCKRKFWFKVFARTRCRYCWKAASSEYAEVKKSSVGPFIVFEDSEVSPILVQSRIKNSSQILLISSIVRIWDRGLFLLVFIFAVAPNLKSFAAEVVAPEGPWKLLNSENPKSFSRSGLSWLRAWGLAMGNTTWFDGAPRRNRGVESRSTPNLSVEN